MIESLSESNRKEIEALKKRIDEEIETLHRLQSEGAKKMLEGYKKLNPWGERVIMTDEIPIGAIVTAQEISDNINEGCDKNEKFVFLSDVDKHFIPLSDYDKLKRESVSRERISKDLEKLDLQIRSMKEDYGEEPRLWRSVPKITYMELIAVKKELTSLLKEVGY